MYREVVPGVAIPTGRNVLDRLMLPLPGVRERPPAERLRLGELRLIAEPASRPMLPRAFGVEIPLGFREMLGPFPVPGVRRLAVSDRPGCRAFGRFALRSSVEPEGERLIEGPPVRDESPEGLRVIEPGVREPSDGVRFTEGTELRGVEPVPGLVRDPSPGVRLISLLSEGDRVTGAPERPESELRARSDELNGERETDGARSDELKRESLPDGRFIWPSGRATEGDERAGESRNCSSPPRSNGRSEREKLGVLGVEGRSTERGAASGDRV